MPKKIDYPRASLARALDAAEAVDALGGKCSAEMCAEKMGMKIGGGFSAVISAASKFNLIDNTKGNLINTPLFKSIKYAYTEDERIDFIKEAFLSAPIFQEVYERFINKRLPVEHLDRLFIREFTVDPSLASRVASYFIEGAKHVGILDEVSLTVKPSESGEQTSNSPEAYEVIHTKDIERNIDTSETQSIPQSNEITFLQETDDYTVQIKGPGIDTKIVIREEDDIEIVNLTLSKIKKKLPL